MANPNTPRGLLPYCHFDGSVWNGSANKYYLPSGYATALFIGDPVSTLSTNNDNFGVPSIQVMATPGTTPIIGVIVGIVAGGQSYSYSSPVTRDQPIYHLASTVQYVLVADDPNLLYMVQDDASAQATAANLWAGLNANLVAGSGSTTTGYSGWQLASSTVAVTNTLDVKIMRPLDQPDNVVGTVANTNTHAKWLVKLNRYQYANQIAGV